MNASAIRMLTLLRYLSDQMSISLADVVIDAVSADKAAFIKESICFPELTQRCLSSQC
jgi:hypothetical protein